MNYIEYEVLTAVVMKSSVIMDIMVHSPLKASQYFRGTCSLHLQGQRVCQAINEHYAVTKQSHPLELDYMAYPRG
jgi:hypothetical protein